MGLASSQVRLLSLTSRQHSLERKAQFLQAQKVRLANDSDKVYDKYVEALDATKLETRIVSDDNKYHWVDGSLNNLMMYDAASAVAGNIFFVQNVNNGKLYVKKDIADAYDEAGGNLMRFYDKFGVKYTENVHEESYINAKIIVDYDRSLGWDVLPSNYTEAFLNTYYELNAIYTNPPKSELYHAADTILGITNYAVESKKSHKKIYLGGYENDLKTLKANIETIKSSGSSYITPNIQTILDFCTNFDTNFPDLQDSNKENIKQLSATNDEYQYIAYDQNKLIDNMSENIYLTDKERLRLILNGGSYSLNGAENKNVYSDAVQTALNDSTNTVLPNIGDALKEWTKAIKKGEMDKARSVALNDLNTYLTSQGTTKSEVERILQNYETYRQDLINFNLQPSMTHTEYEDPNLAIYYETIFNAIKAAGGYNVLNDSQAKDGNWVHSMVKNAQVVLAKFNNEKDELDNITAGSSGALREISNKQAIQKADSEYETALEDINEKEEKYNLELSKSEEERNAIQNEIQSLKKIAKENVERTFKLFS